MAKNNARAKKVGSAVAAISAAVGLAAGIVHGGGGTSMVGGTPSAITASAASTSVKRFSVPIANLRDWSRKVLVTLPNVQISGHSPVHTIPGRDPEAGGVWLSRGRLAIASRGLRENYHPVCDRMLTIGTRLTEVIKVGCVGCPH
jgi:hypothetical protein